MFSSTVIPTIGRSTLSVAVYSVLQQTVSSADFEVIVVNDSGQRLPDMEWQRSARVRVISTDRRERSVARNAGAAIARGKYLHFLDDDDRLLPGALEAFWTLDQAGGAAWLYGGYQTVDNYGNLLAEVRPGISGDAFALLVSGESIPFQVSMLSTRHFFSAGGFDPDPALIGVEDRDLGRRIALNATLAGTHAIVAQIRVGQQGSTTNWATIAEADRWGREKALSIESAFTRLRASATSGYWSGRLARAYCGSMMWNLRHSKLISAASRATAGLAFVGRRAFSPDFWHGFGTGLK